MSSHCHYLKLGAPYSDILLWMLFIFLTQKVPIMGEIHLRDKGRCKAFCGGFMVALIPGPGDGFHLYSIPISATLHPFSWIIQP